MKKWVMIVLVILVSAATGTGYYYYNYIYRAPEAVESRELMETNSAYEYLIADAKSRIATGNYTYKVLINPIGGGRDNGITAGELKESEVVLSVARYVESLNEDETLGIFMTRDTDTDPTYEQRLSFVEVVDPDIIIELRIDSSDNSDIMGTSVWYDDEYYDYHLVNSHLADVMVRCIVTKIQGVAAGIFPLEDGFSDYVKLSHRPSAVIKLGYASNDKESQALLSETYRSNLGLGILDAISQLREETEPEIKVYG